MFRSCLSGKITGDQLLVVEDPAQLRSRSDLPPWTLHILNSFALGLLYRLDQPLLQTSRFMLKLGYLHFVDFRPGPSLDGLYQEAKTLTAWTLDLDADLSGATLCLFSFCGPLSLERNTSSACTSSLALPSDLFTSLRIYCLEFMLVFDDVSTIRGDQLGVRCYHRSKHISPSMVLFQGKTVDTCRKHLAKMLQTAIAWSVFRLFSLPVSATQPRHTRFRKMLDQRLFPGLA